VTTVASGDELRRHANAIAGFTNASLEDVSHIQGLGDAAYVLLLALECKCRRARNHLQSGCLDEQVDDFFG
jgi:hypothetical protein